MIVPDNIKRAIKKDTDIEKNINDFESYLVSHEVDEVIDKYLLFGTPYIFRNNESLYYQLLKDIEKYFGVGRENVFVVGSSKLGFSISPIKRYKEWGEDSDIDIAIIDYGVFLNYWKETYTYNPDCDARTIKENERFAMFLSYLSKGWLRPDMFPKKMGDELFSFLRELHGLYNYKVRVGFYADRFFFNEYNKDNLMMLKKECIDGTSR